MNLPFCLLPVAAAMLGAQADVDAELETGGDDEPVELYVETELDSRAQDGPLLARVPLDLAAPLTFQPTDPAQRAGARLWLGPPDLQHLRVFYEHSLGLRASAGGYAGVEEGAGRVGGFGRYAPLYSKSAGAYLSMGGEAYLSLGDRTGLFLQPEVAGGVRAGDRIDLQAKAYARLDLGGNNPGWGPGFMDDVEYGLMGEGALRVVEGGWIHLGAAARLEPTRLGDAVTSQVFTSLTLGGRYRVSETIALGLGATAPLYHRYRDDLSWAVALSADYRF